MLMVWLLAIIGISLIYFRNKRRMLRRAQYQIEENQQESVNLAQAYSKKEFFTRILSVQYSL